MSTAGRGAQQSTVNQGQSNLGYGNNVENQAQNYATQAMNLSGGLSPLVSKQLANEQGQIGKAYQSAGQAQQRGLSQRGMGSAPSGLSASIANTGVNNLGQAQTGAIGNAFGTQQNLNATALNPALAAEGAQAGNIGDASGANQALASMPSLGQQIFSGLQGVANSAGNVMGGYGKLLQGENSGNSGNS